MPDRIVHVIDDDQAVRDSLSMLIESAGLRVCAYEAAEDLLGGGEAPKGCIVTDVRMPGMTGLDLVRRLRADGVATPVIMITGHGDVPLAVEAMRQGVFDFLEKPFDDEVLLDSIGRALAEAREQGSQRAEAEKVKAAFSRLSAREQDVLAGLVAGKPNKVIALDHGISPRTVEIYRANVMSKTGASSLSELVRMAMLADRA